MLGGVSVDTGSLRLRWSGKSAFRRIWNIQFPTPPKGEVRPGSHDDARPLSHVRSRLAANELRLLSRCTALPLWSNPFSSRSLAGPVNPYRPNLSSPCQPANHRRSARNKQTLHPGLAATHLDLASDKFSLSALGSAISRQRPAQDNPLCDINAFPDSENG